MNPTRSSTARLITNSGGATSGYQAYLEMQKGLGTEDYIVYTNTGKEAPQTLAFLHRQQTEMGMPIRMIEYCPLNKWKEVDFFTASRKGEPFEAVIARRALLRDRAWVGMERASRFVLLYEGQITEVGGEAWTAYYAGFDEVDEDRDVYDLSLFQEIEVKDTRPVVYGTLPNSAQRWCTEMLKTRVMRDFMHSMGHRHYTKLVGLRADEAHRYHRLKATNSREAWDIESPLYQMGVTVADVNAFWDTQPFRLELRPHEGNCDLCFMKGEAKLAEIIRGNPGAATWWSDMEKATGSEFRQGKTYESLEKRANSDLFYQMKVNNEPTYSCFCGD